MKINNIDEIDFEKLNSLLKKRGHGIINQSFISQLKHIFSSNNPDVEVHQCDCGELIVFTPEHITQIIKEYGLTEFVCKECGGYQDTMLRMDLLERFEKVLDYSDEKYIFVDDQRSFLESPDVKKLTELAYGLFPTNTHEEYLLGVYDFVTILNAHFDKNVNPYQKTVNDFFNSVNNKVEFDNLYENVINWKTFHKYQVNVTRKGKIADLSYKHKVDQFLSNQIITTDLHSIDMDIKLTKYKDMIENRVFLDILMNVIRIINGDAVSLNPFNRNITLFNRIKEIQQQLSFDISSFHNTHLRNAIAHNQYEILENGDVYLLKYDENYTESDINSIISNLSLFHTAILHFFSERHIDVIRSNPVNLGISDVVLGYDDFEIVNNQLVPVGLTIPRLLIYQYWNFGGSYFNKREVPDFSINFCKEDQEMVVDFTDYVPFNFPYDPQLTNWIETMIMQGAILIDIIKIAPPLPVFAKMDHIKISLKNTDFLIIGQFSKKIYCSEETLKQAYDFIYT